MKSRPLVLVDLLSYTGTKGGMETYTRELYRELGTMDTGLDFVALASKEGLARGHVVVPRRGDRARGSAARTASSGPSASWSRRRGRPAAAGPTWCTARRPSGPMHTSMPTVMTIHDMLYWSHPELMSTPLYTRAGEVDGEARRRQRDARDHRQPGVGGRDRQVPRLPDRPAARRARWPPTHACDRTPRPCAPENLVLASGQRRPHKNWDRPDPGASRWSRGASDRGWSSPAPAARTRSRPLVDRLGLGDG